MRPAQVIRPALLWNDQRTAAECAEIEEKAGGREALVRMVANPALTGFTAPEALVGPKARAEELGAGAAGAAAEGLCAVQADGHLRDRGERRLGDAFARRGQPSLER